MKAIGIRFHSNSRSNIQLFLRFLLLLITGNLPVSMIISQASNPQAVKAMITRYKQDPRGPYKDIRWFCQDGTTRAARDPCPDIPGNQRARYKEEVDTLAEKDHIFLGQILATTPYTAFWDDDHAQSRLVQYQLHQYLFMADNGWVNRRAQFYRGAVQTEDENAWGTGFLKWLLEDSNIVHSHYFILRQSAKDIPHAADNNTTQLVRTLSRYISDTFPGFLDLRVKIHGLPDEGDIKRVEEFERKNKASIPAELTPKFDSLLQQMAIMYRPFSVRDFEQYLDTLPAGSKAAYSLRKFLDLYPVLNSPEERCKIISHTGLLLRKQMMSHMKSNARLALIDISNKLESLLKKDVTQWKASSLEDLLSQAYCLAEAAAAFGFLERWEWDQISKDLEVPEGDSITLQMLNDYSEEYRHVMEWGTGMVRATYTPVIKLYRDFEPKAEGFYDDRIRSSILLLLGLAVGQLGEALSHQAGFSNDVLNISGQSAIHGLNPGYALGQLVVVKESPEAVKFSPESIYVLHHPPSNLKPVAGIMTVSEGNMVSHVQLLARNMGIPNAVISKDNMEAIYAFNGTKVFYAVSNKGTVILKPASAMDSLESKLFSQKKQRQQKITVPVEHIVLNHPHILDLRDVNASQSGKTCGPKAANLGQLKLMFPDHVVDGMVLPFSVFYQHMNQPIPGSQITYWELMQGIFDKGDVMRRKGVKDPEIEAFVLHGLDSLRGLIKKMPLRPDFTRDLEEQFLAIFKLPLGQVPVFVRSDTNMEDLKDFTGAGLNLTVFNVLDTAKIFQGIRDVWASPYTERSFKWRQVYLNNPENVFPSILIIPSVDADYSGVLITKGLSTGSDVDMTIAFNRGAGGAVDGQATESWLLHEDGRDQLITPSREATYLSIPPAGGSQRLQTTFEQRILSPENLDVLRTLSSRILRELPGSPGIHTDGPFDLELGFKKDRIWLFQVRPFVENKQAAASEYLRQITPVFESKHFIALDLKL